MPDHDRLPRRTLLQLSGATTLAALAGCFDPDYGSGARDPADDADEPDYGEWFEDALGYEATEDRRDDDEVTIAVGAGDDGLAYDPAAVAVAPGTTLIFEWTGEGGVHNVVVRDGPADIEYAELEDEAGFVHEVTVDEDGIGVTRYYCEPHEALGMKGAIVVADPEDELGEFAFEENDEEEDEDDDDEDEEEEEDDDDEDEEEEEDDDDDEDEEEEEDDDDEDEEEEEDDDDEDEEEEEDDDEDEEEEEDDEDEEEE